MNLIETNLQINMTSDNFVSSNNLFKNLLNAVAVAPGMMILLQCLLLGWLERTRVLWIQLQEKTEK